MSTTVKVGIVMGSDSDREVMRGAEDSLEKLGIGSEVRVLSAHRTPDQAAEYAKTARKRGLCVIIAGAGGAAHLAGAMAAHSDLPVIGVPVAIPPLQGLDSLLATVQMPRGIPVATVAIGNSANAGILAAQIMACGASSDEQSSALERVQAYRKEMQEKSLAKS